MAPLLDIFGMLTTLVVGWAALKGVLDAFFALRAKQRAINVISETNVLADQKLKDLAVNLTANNLDTAGVEILGSALASSLDGHLSLEDRKLVDRGLHQQSRLAERRYIEDMISSHERSIAS
jgi:hypothetical protein